MITSGSGTEAFIYYEYIVYLMLQLYFLEGKKRKPHEQTIIQHGGTVQLNLVYEI